MEKPNTTTSVEEARELRDRAKALEASAAPLKTTWLKAGSALVGALAVGGAVGYYAGQKRACPLSSIPSPSVGGSVPL